VNLVKATDTQLSVRHNLTRVCNQASRYAIKHIYPASQDKLGGLWQEGHPA